VSRDRYHYNRRRLAAHLVGLGPRAVLEALHDVDAGRGVDEVLASYGRLPTNIVASLGGDAFPVPPIYVVSEAAA